MSKNERSNLLLKKSEIKNKQIQNNKEILSLNDKLSENLTKSEMINKAIYKLEKDTK